MALFIDIQEFPQKGGVIRHIFLSNRYTKEELAEELEPFVGTMDCSKKYLDDILEKGKYLKKKTCIKLKHQTIVTTQINGFKTFYLPKKKNLTIYPDGTWSEEPYLNFFARVRKIWDTWCQDWAKPR